MVAENTSFKDWYYGNKGHEHLNEIENGAKAFEKATDVKIDSLSAFISWLTVNKHISGYVKNKKGKRPVSLMSFSDEKKVLFLVKNVKKIKELAAEYNKKIGNFGALR